jgi:hypothetical protein
LETGFCFLELESDLVSGLEQNWSVVK